MCLSANAQIKIVGDSYKESLSGAKSYYDKDIDFESIFPHLSPLEHRHEMEPTLKLCNENMVGDTVFLPDTLFNDWKSIILDSLPFSRNGQEIHYDEFKTEKGKRMYYFIPYISHDGGVSWKVACDTFISEEKHVKQVLGLRGVENKITTSYRGEIIATIPSGYYVIHGYVFCSDNAKKIESENESDIKSIYELKTDILLGEKIEIKNILAYIILSPINNKDILYAYPYSFCENLISVRFYNELKEKLVGQKVRLYPSYPKYQPLELGTIIEDDIRKESFKLMDEVLDVKDVVLKGSDFFLILSGDQTGSFAIRIGEISSYYDGVEKGGVYYYYIQSNFPFARGWHFDIKPIAGWQNYEKFIQTAANRTQQEIQRARLSKEQQVEKEKIEYKNRMIAKYGEEKGTLVGNHQICIGMTKEMCKDAWGTPINNFKTTTAGRIDEMWYYNYKTRVYFVNGKIQQIDN